LDTPARSAMWQAVAIQVLAPVQGCCFFRLFEHAGSSAPAAPKEKI